ncbi:class I SAM-dependent methyltransferase family protein [Candidatus Omnitrophota bacterium]
MNRGRVITTNIKTKIEDFWYRKIIKNILSLSKLGRTSIKGAADSGLNFDHMYRAKPKGITSFGRFVDKVLLNLPSVKATRNRKEIVIKILQNEIANNLYLKRKTRIVDVASGPARYLTELIDGSNQHNVEVLCIDKDIRSLNFGKILAGDKPIRFTKADVLRIKHLKRLSKKIAWIPNIVLLSGLLEYKDDDFVLQILRDIHNSISYDGLLLFISQVDNPSKKLMSKVCVTSEGNRWELVYRKPEIFRKWLLDLGFKNVIISVDQWGMYEFCTCRKYS